MREVARRHHVWAITRSKNQAVIRRELERAPLPNLRMVYFDAPRSMLALKRGQLGVEVYYRAWHVLTRDIIRRLHKDIRFDVTQHVTFGRYWGPTSLAYLPVPFVWGPLGGGETAPSGFFADFGWRGRFYERLRDAARRCGEWAPSVRRAAHSAVVGLAVTPETRDRMLAMGTKRVELFSAMGFDRAGFEHLCNLPSPPEAAGTLRFVSIGRLLHWKGFHLALKAFATANLPRSEYWIVGEGPERGRLARLARRLGAEERVRFLGPLPRPQTLDALAACHVLIHPSLHDSGGWVCLEAMSAAKPVICLDLGGPAEQVTPETGVKVPAKHPDQAVRELAGAMTDLGLNAELRHVMGHAGRRRVAQEYLWERKGERLDAIYASILEQSKCVSA